MAATLIRNARVLTFDAEDRDLARGDILVEGDRIVSVAEEVEAPSGAAVIDAAGHLAMPGLINSHLHSPGNLMKGMLDGLPLELFMLHEVPPLAKGAASGRLAYVRTLLGAVEMLKQGVTSVMDDAFHVPLATVEGVDAICTAYRDVGMRVWVAIDQPNVVEYEKYPFLADLLPPPLKRDMEASPRHTDAELLALYDHLIRTWDGAGEGRIRAALSCSAPQRVTVPYLNALSSLSAERRLPFNIHVLETKLQRVLGDEKYGRSLVRYAHDQGAFGPHTVVIHAIWIDEVDIAILAEAGAVVAHNPVCNLRLGSGIAPFRSWRDAGIPVCIGTDEAIADDSISLWGALKMTGLLHTLADGDWTTWPTAAEVLDVAMRGGARALGTEGEIGQLEPGAKADIVLVDLDTIPFTPLNDLKRQLVFCETGCSVRDVMVAGSWVVREGRVQTLDEAALRKEARDLMRYSENDALEARAAARRLEPFYRDMVLRAHARDVGLRRRLDG